MKQVVGLMLALCLGVALDRMMMSSFATAGGVGPEECAEENGDANASGDVDLSDAVTILNFLFQGSPIALPPLCADVSQVEDLRERLAQCQAELESTRRELEDCRGVEDCTNRMDDDGDTFIDCADPDCADSPVCVASQPQVGDIVITEIMADPMALVDGQGEWFEVFNASSTTTFNLRGCTIADNGATSHTIGDELIIAPHALLTLAASGNPGFVPSYVYSGFALANTEDEIILTCDGFLVDQVAYGQGFVSAGASKELQLSRTTAVDNDDPSNWCPATQAYNGDLGTPGGSNLCP